LYESEASAESRKLPRKSINYYQELLEYVGSGLKAPGNTQIDSHSPAGVITLGQQVVPILYPCAKHNDQKLVLVLVRLSRVRDEW